MEVDLQREGRISVTPKRIQGKPTKLKKEERSHLSQALNNERIGANVLTNFIDDINTSNEESIDEGHAPSWVLEKSAKNLAERALVTGNKNWLDMIGEVDTYGGGNYAQTQKGRKIIRDTITLIDSASNKREDREYKLRTRKNARLEQEYELKVNQILGMDEDTDEQKNEKEAKLAEVRKEGFNKGYSDVYQKVYNNYDLIVKREGAPKILTDDDLLDKVFEQINLPNGYTDYETMRSGITTFLAENNIKIAETQQSKIDSVLKAYTPLEKIEEFKELDESIKSFGTDFIKELSVGAEFVPDKAKLELANQKIALMREWRKVFNEHRIKVRDASEKKQFVPYGSWSKDQKKELYDALVGTRDEHLKGARTAVKGVYDKNKPTQKPEGANDEYNRTYKEHNELVYKQKVGELNEGEKDKLKDLALELEYRWPKKWKEYQDAKRGLEETHRETVSFAEGADTDHTKAIRGILADNAFESPAYIERQVSAYLNKQGLALDERARTEIDQFKAGVVKVEDIPTTKDSLKMFDDLITNIFPGYQVGLLSLASMDMTKKIPNIPMQALFIIRDKVDEIKNRIKDELKKQVEEKNAPIGLWSDKEKTDFNDKMNAEIKRDFLNWSEKGDKAELITTLKGLAPDDPNIKQSEAEQVEQMFDAISDAFPSFKGKVNQFKTGEAISKMVLGLTNKTEMRELYQKLMGLKIPPNEIDDMRMDILSFIVAYYTLIK